MESFATACYAGVWLRSNVSRCIREPIRNNFRCTAPIAILEETLGSLVFLGQILIVPILRSMQTARSSHEI